jgi:hypothetical protein
VIRVLVGDAANGLAQLGIALGGITVCVDAQDEPELLVSDTRNHRVVAFQLDGSAARVVCGTGKEGSSTGELSNPRGVVVTATGELWLVEAGNDRVSLFR